MEKQVKFGDLLAYLNNLGVSHDSVLTHVWESVPDSDGNRSVVLVFMDDQGFGSVKEIRVSLSVTEIVSCVFDPING